MLRVGLIGLGDVSPIHVHAIHASDHGELVAVCDTNTELSSNFPEIPFFSNVDRMLEKMNLDVVHICLPHDLHYPITQKCVEHDVHVYLEKPVAMTYEEALEQLEVKNRTDKKICVSFQNRYNASFIRLMEILRNEDVGEVTSIKGLVTWFRPESYYTSKPWRGQKDRAGYGSIINQSIHTLDLIQLIGGDLKSCKAVLSNLTDYDIEVEDTASATFTFTSGVKAFFHATNAYTENSSVEIQVITEKEKFTIKDSRLYITNDEGRKEVIVEDDKLPGSKFYYGAGHMYLINRFYESILNDTDDYVTIEDSIPSMQMIKLMDLSSNNTKRPERTELEEINYVTS
ncbi:Gfo/Idh/MocA family protein [Alkalibacterium putridalgicola]|uniref:Gfo/Idh/MocA family protein n=1 Tax=Alkalibacterium putridalgicola TaxID=426703 RepID=UPI0034CF622A